MTAISSPGDGSAPLQAAKTYGRYTRSGSETQPAPAETGDSVEVSEEAKRLAREREDMSSLMQPAKTLRAGTEEYDAFRNLMDTVKSRKKDIASRIDALVKESGVAAPDRGKLKIEVDSSGKILVGGIADKAAIRALEAALNSDKSLGADIREYQQNERELSRRIKDYTGCTLYELTMTAAGDTNARIREHLEGDGKFVGSPDYYMRLGFLGSAQEFVTADDIAELSFGGGVDFSGEVDFMANPEGNIKKSLDQLQTSIQSAFDELNAELLERFEALGEKPEEGTLLDLLGTVVRLDSDGGVAIEGAVSSDPELNQKGMEIIKRLAEKLLNDTETNSYHANAFLAASHNLLNRDGVADTARVVAELAHGKGGNIRPEAIEKTSPLRTAVKNSILKATEAVLR